MTNESPNRAERRRLAREADALKPKNPEHSEFRLLEDCYICSSYIEGLKRGAYANADQLENQPGYKFVISKVPADQREKIEDEIRKVFATQSLTVKVLMANPTVKKIIEFGTRPLIGKLKAFHVRDAPELVVLHQTSQAW